MAGLDQTHATYARAVARLADPSLTRLVLVARAQPSALAEAARTSGELAALGITSQHLVVNAVLPEEEGDDDPLADALRAREQAAVAAQADAVESVEDRVRGQSFIRTIGHGAIVGAA